VDDTGEHELDVDIDSPWHDNLYLPPRRRRMGGWIVAFFLLPSLVLIGWVAEKRFHVVALLEHRATPPSSVDPRVESFLTEGERALGEGDLEGAQGDFDKASVLTERDPRVLVGEARVAAAKADVPWLRLRLLLPHASEEARVTTAVLNERVALASRTADDALSAAPQDPLAMRAKLDALRLAGDSQAARGYVVAVFAQASEPETAYVLAVLDLGQPASPLATVVDRLRAATAGTGAAGRARAALVYALVKSGDMAGAKVELAKLDAQARLYPLLPDLHMWMALDPAATAARPLAELPAASSAPSATDPAGSAQSPAAPGAAAAAAGDPARAGPRSTLQAANQAISRGDFDRAERIYQGILATDPNDSQALAGLGDVRRLHGDPWGAIDAYQSAIKINPSYLPALLGLADTQWSRGDKAGAARSYKRIVDGFPDGMYPDYVSQRIAP
jgi:tetratricopeptide (TPR) repeat protein